MSLKRVVQLTEGPMDFVRGVARQVAPAVRNVAQAGRQTSAVADLTKAVTALVQLLQSEVGQPAQPAPQYQQAGRQSQPTGTTQQMSTRPQMTFSAYLQTIDGDRLDEGAWDVIKRGASAVAKGIGGAVSAVTDPDGPAMDAFRKKFAHDQWLSKMFKGSGRSGNEGSSEQQKQNLIQQIQQILKRVQNPQNTLKRVIGQTAGTGAIANQIFSMVFPSTRPTPATRPAQSATNVQAQWSQPATSGQPVQPRTRGPANRRPRPTAQQP